MSVKRNLVSRLTRTRLLFPLLLIVLLLPALYFYATRPKETAAWWNESWIYRKRIDISNPGGSDLTDFQISFTLDTTDTSKFQGNCEDLRITDVNGNLLPFWIEENNPGCGDANTKVWVKLPSIPSSGTYIYAYYGNPSASQSSDHDGEKVFEFFDDFSSNSLNTTKWQKTNGGTPTLSNGTLTITATINPGKLIALTAPQGDNYILRTRFQATAGANGDGRAGVAIKTNTSDGRSYNYVLRDFINLNQIRFLDDNVAWGTSSYGSWLKNTYYTAEIYHNGTNVYGRTNDGTWNSQTWSGRTGYPALNFGSHSDTTTVWDFALVRKAASTEPTTSVQSEEIGPGPIAYWKFDEGTGSTVNDSSSNAINGSFINTPQWQLEESCINGKCLLFSSTSDEVNINSPKFRRDSLSICAWINPSSTSSRQDFIRSGHRGKYATNNWIFSIESGKLRVYGDTTHITTDNAVLTPNTWQHVCFTNNGSSTSIFLNGELTKTGNHTINNNDTTGERIGGPGYLGFIDELKIFPYALTTSQVLQDYNQYANSIGGRSNSLSNGLVGYWKMDEASWNGTSDEVTDSSGNNNHATSAYGANVTTGKYGNAGNFDGTDDQVDTTATNLFPYTNNFTISAWIKPTTLAHARIAGHAGTAKGFGLGIRSTGAIWLVTQSVKDYVTTTTPITTNSWQLLTAVMDSNNDVSFYLNGTFIEKVTHASPAVANTDTVFRIGQWNSTYKFTGSIDEVRVYNRALSASEVSSLYHFAPGPQLYYNFDEGTGSSVYDISGNGNTGTWSGSGSHWLPGKYGGAASFNGTNDVISSSLNTNSLYDISTFELWFRPSTISKTGLISGYPSANPIANRWDIQLSRLGGNDAGWISHQGGGYISTTTPIQAEVWHHLAIIHDYTNNSTKIYLNGNLEQTGTAPYPTNTSINLLIGNGDGGYYHGLIDEVKIYNYARTEEQIRQDMAGTANPGINSSNILPQPVSHWSFDEQTGQTAYDKISGKNGTLGATTSIDSDDPAWKPQNNCITNGCLNFDGTDDHIRISNFTYPNNQSISFWIKPSTLTSNEWIIGSSWHYEISIRSGKIQFTTHDGTSYQYCTGTTNINDNSYHFITTTYEHSSQTKKIYVNGKQEAICQQGSNAPGTTGVLTIGGGSYFEGYIDEIKIYNTVLSAEQIKQDMNTGSTLSVGTTTNEATDLSDGEGNPPVAEWKLDEMQGSTVSDTSGNNYSGTITGATWNAWCKYGSCLSFNGSEYVDLGTSRLTITGNITLSAWINTSSSADGGIISKYANHGYWTYRLYMDTNGKAVFNRGYDASWTTSVTSNASINDGQWHHISATYDGSNMAIYIDGTKDNSIAENRNSDPTSIWNLCIASDNYNCYSSSGVGKFTGKIDHVRIYDYARTPAQIAYDYNRGEPVAHWKMDECQGSTIHDSSDNGNHGTWNGSGGTQTSVGTCTTAGTAWGNGATGKFGASLNFDGEDDYINMGTQSIYNIVPDDTKAGSLSFWIKTTDSNESIIDTKNAGSNTAGYDMRVASNGAAHLRVANGSAQQSTTSNKLINDGQWHHVIGIIDRVNSKLLIYIDGSLDKEITLTLTGSFSTSKFLTIGSYGVNAGNGNINAQLDDIRIYNYALSAMQVKKVMNEGSALRFGD